MSFMAGLLLGGFGGTAVGRAWGYSDYARMIEAVIRDITIEMYNDPVIQPYFPPLTPDTDFTTMPIEDLVRILNETIVNAIRSGASEVVALALRYFYAKLTNQIGIPPPPEIPPTPIT